MVQSETRKKDYHKNRNITIRLSNKEWKEFEDIKKENNEKNDARMLKRLIIERKLVLKLNQTNQTKIEFLEKEMEKLRIRYEAMLDLSNNLLDERDGLKKN